MTNLVRLLDDIRGATFCGIDYVVDVALTGGKANPHKGRVTKRHNGASVMLFTNENSNGYNNMVRRRLEKEGQDPDKFVLGPRTWGTRVPGFPIVAHTPKGSLIEKHYFEVIFLKPGESIYFLDGVLTEKELIQGIPVVKASEEGQGGLSEENRVQLRTFALDSIVQIRINQLNVVGPFHFKPPA